MTEIVGIVHRSILPHIDHSALIVVQRLNACGFDAYVVGGSVRDILVGETPKDFDIVTNAEPQQIKKVFGRQCLLIGNRFKLAHVRYKNTVIEVATFREKTEKQWFFKSPNQNQYGKDIRNDAVQRDFTLNAMYFDINKESIIDFYNGLEDVRQKRIVIIGEPEERYKEDPVRMLRAIKLLAKLNFQLEEKTGRAIKYCAGYLSTVNKSRLSEEILKLFNTGHAFKSFVFLKKFGLLPGTIPDIDKMDAHHQHLFLQLLQQLDLLVKKKKQNINPSLIFAILLWMPLQIYKLDFIARDKKSKNIMSYAQYQTLKIQNTVMQISKWKNEEIQKIWSLQAYLEKNAHQTKLSRSNYIKDALILLKLRLDIGELPPSMFKHLKLWDSGASQCVTKNQP